jgi:iron complex outermembrane receptor protein
MRARVGTGRNRKTAIFGPASPSRSRGLFVASIFFVVVLGQGIAGRAAAQGTGSIRGRAIGADGHVPRTGEATLVDQRRRSPLGELGDFEFDSLAEGSYLVVVTTPLHGDGVARVDVAAGAVSEVEVQLNLTTHSEEMVVSASPDVRSQLELASPTTVLSGEDLMLRRQGSLGETLADEPGISSTSFSAGASRPVIRGLEGDRVRMLQGGIGVGDASATSPDHAVSVDPAAAERIEVIRGPATLLYGSSAIGGVVNVEDSLIPIFEANLPFSGKVDLWAGSVDDQTGGAAALGGGGGHWAWSLQGTARDADDYRIPGFAEVGAEGEIDEEPAHGRLPNSAVETTSVGVGGSYFFGHRGFLGASVSGFESEYGLPGAHEEESHDEGDGHHELGGPRIDLSRTRFDLRGELSSAFGPFRGLRGRFGLVDYEHDELEPDGAVGTTFLNDAWEARVEAVQLSRGRWSGSVGVQLGQDEAEARGEEAFIPRHETGNWGLFVFEEVGFEDWSLQFGGRVDGRDLDVADAGSRDRSFSDFSASVGAVYRPNEVTAVGLSLASAAKFPTGQELYADGAHLAVQAYEIGNEDLGGERSLGFDLFLRRSEGRVAGEISLFRQDFDDFIFQAFTGELIDGLPVVLYSQTDAEFTGAEAKASIEVWEHKRNHLDFRVFADYVRAEASATGDNLPRIPPLGFGGGVHYHGEHYHGMVEVRHRDGQDDLAPNETPTASNTVINASFSYRFLVGDRIFDALLRGRNLTDEEVRNHTSYVKDSVPLPGRDVTLSLRLHF